jgi:hypothetical protein
LWCIISRKETAGERGGQRLEGHATIRTETAALPPKTYFSCVDCPSFHRKGRLAYGSEMVGRAVEDLGTVFRTTGKLEHGDSLSNQLRCAPSDDGASVRCPAGDDPH